MEVLADSQRIYKRKFQYHLIHLFLGTCLLLTESKKKKKSHFKYQPKNMETFGCNREAELSAAGKAQE